MSSSGLIYAVIVGAWAAYLVPMWLRRQDELNEARPTERFSTAIRLLSGRAGMERRYARDLRARSADEAESDADPDAVTDSVDVRAFAMGPYRPQTKAHLPVPPERSEAPTEPVPGRRPSPRGADRAPGLPEGDKSGEGTGGSAPDGTPGGPGRPLPRQQGGGQTPPAVQGAQGTPASSGSPDSAHSSRSSRSPGRKAGTGRAASERARRNAAAEAAARARRSKVLARRRRTTVLLFLAFTLGTIVAAVGGLALLWAPGVPAVLLSGYIAYLRAQERRRFAYVMDRRRAEQAAQRLRERRPRRRPVPEQDADEPEDGPETEPAPGFSALAADRRALVEQTDHAEWVDQQRERQRRPGQGDSWDPVPVPLPTYVTAPVAPRATPSVDLGGPDAWSSARSGVAEPGTAPAGTPAARPSAGREPESPSGAPADSADDGGDHAGGGPGAQESGERCTEGGDDRSDARRAASARRSRERGRTPLFDQYEDGERPRAANE